MDFTTYYDGSSLILLTPVSDAACNWADQNLPDDAPSLGFAIAVELRYIGDIVAGIQADGLTVTA